MRFEKQGTIKSYKSRHLNTTEEIADLKQEKPLLHITATQSFKH